MAYAPPAITAAGLSVPAYLDFRAVIVDAYRSIYGASTYLGNDDKDYQWISAIALKMNDNAALCQLAYNSRSILTAVGAALDAIVKPIMRKGSTASTCQVTVSGTPGKMINNGVVADRNGIYWTLPPQVTIGPSGSTTVSAVCQQFGPISAEEGTITNPIGGNTAGWNGVTNPFPAVLGSTVETDSQLRARALVSLALPSSTRLAATRAAIAELPGVNRFNALENQTSAVDTYGNAGHSLTCVVEGGTDIDIATAIFRNRGIGCNTIGAVVDAGQYQIPVTDPKDKSVMNIGIIRPGYMPVLVNVTLREMAGFSIAMFGAIQNAIVSYLNSLQIGETVVLSELYGAALSARSNPEMPAFSIRSITMAGGIRQRAVPVTGSDTLVVPDPTGIAAGMTIVCEENPIAFAGITVTGLGAIVDGGTQVHLSGAIGAGASLETSIDFFPALGTNDLFPSFYQVAAGVLNATTVTTG